ncbi:sulfatase-like hydrolase/transferase [Coraliomargarita sp. SDUM461003]|uniref:Sulfatase-like hydrolase/transferase n=1 Tax=Thalassobacterium maritimum TaxID=3041265 RepID=A0ABU1AT25_9BACT|nr:sulfatase-like hydrolase/transferase [Coraliomargarita sp. SDUM461003]MDQ8207311.1 sulfatase-like hydrolase/transferase [Coraliomargarita sp. SDUM461003]
MRSTSITRLSAVTLLCLLLKLTALAETPNVLLIVSDDLNGNMGAFGHPLVQTPQLDSLAAQSLRFERAYCQWPVCGPSRASFLTGLYPDQNGVKDLKTSVRDILPQVVTLPQYFKNHGYQSARVGKLYHMNNPNGIGQNGEDDAQSWDERFNPAGVDNSSEVRNEIKILNRNGSAWQSGGWTSTGARLSYLAAEGTTSDGVDKGDPLTHTDGMVATKAISLIDDYTQNAQPFFLAVGFFKPHTPFVAPKSFFDLYDPDDIVVPTVPADYYSTLPAAAVATLRERSYENGLDATLARQTIHAYYATISFMDAQVGRVLAALDDPNGDGDHSDSIRDNTIVVFLSDHGYHMGEHDKYQKTTLFEDATRAPLMISAPGMATAGQSTQSLAEFVDLYKTLAELAGLPEPENASGISLNPILNDATSELRDSALTQQDDNYTLRTERYRYTRWQGGGADNIELYDHLSDPQELNNLAYSDPTGHATLIADLDAALTQRIAEAQATMHINLFPGTVDSRAYGGIPHLIPGRIEAENYDEGGELTAYHDVSSGNNLSATDYRDDDVDIALCSDTGGGYNIGGFDGGEWLAYSVDVTAGVYDLHFRLASNNSSHLASIEAYLEGQLLGKVVAPATGGWQNWQTVTLSNVEVQPGGTGRKLVLRCSGSGEKFNLNWVEFALQSTRFDLWQTQFDNWVSASPTPNEDDDGDSSSNGIEYAFNSDPTSPQSAPLLELQVVTSPSAGQISFKRQKYDTSLSYTPKWSVNLNQWHSTGFNVESVTDLGTIEEVCYQKQSEIGHDQLFLKVEVSGL